MTWLSYTNHTVPADNIVTQRTKLRSCHWRVVLKYCVPGLRKHNQTVPGARWYRVKQPWIIWIKLADAYIYIYIYIYIYAFQRIAPNHKCMSILTGVGSEIKFQQNFNPIHIQLDMRVTNMKILNNIVKSNETIYGHQSYCFVCQVW